MAVQNLAWTASAVKQLSGDCQGDNPSRTFERVRGSTPRCPTSHLNPDQYGRLLACIERKGGIATIDEIARALPHVGQPISAVFDLCDAGILGADLESAFDADMRVWRIDR